MDRVVNSSLHVLDGTAAVMFIPAAIEVLGYGPELDNQIVREILGINLPPLLAPKANQSNIVLAHYDSSVRAAYEAPAVRIGVCTS